VSNVQHPDMTVRKDESSNDAGMLITTEPRQRLTANNYHALGALVPKCNDRSQFREDTGKPSVPVREFNLIVC